MKFTRLFLAIVAASIWANAADSPGETKAAPGSSESTRLATAPMRVSLPPVLRPLETPDSNIVRLPGATAPPGIPISAPMVASKPASLPVPVADAPKRPLIPFRYVATRSNPVAVPALPAAPPISTAVQFETPAILEPPKKTLPADFSRDSALFCQKRIGEWTTAEAQALLGDAMRQRSALDDDKTESGRIYAFPDPSGRYKELELDFAKDTGLLRTVFVYPHNLSWVECRRLWGANVSAAEANKGRKFYSYLNRRLDVLVDPSGRVISLGLY